MVGRSSVFFNKKIALMLPSIRCSLLFPTSGRALGLTLKCNSLTALLLLLILKKTLGTNSRRILRIYFFSSFEQECYKQEEKESTVVNHG